MAPKPIVWAFGPIVGTEAWNKLEGFAELRRYSTGNRQDFVDKLDNGAFEGTLAMFRNVDSIKLTGNWDADIMAKMPSTLKFVINGSVGYDSMDVAACTAKGIHVSNTPHANDQAVADHAIFLMLAALRLATTWLGPVRLGQWYGPTPQLGRDPESRVIGILGLGSIGAAIARRALAFGMRVQYHNRHRASPSLEESLGGATYVDFDTLLSTSDVLSLSTALTPETHGILDSAVFGKMKRGIVIVNTARGGLIDESALLRAIEEGTVWSAGLDVFETEPLPTHSPLLASDRIVLSPHVAAATLDTYLRMEGRGFANLEAALTQGKLLDLVVEQRNM